jgi:hypothetical protein
MKGPKRVVDAYIMPIVKAAIDAKSNSQAQDDGNESSETLLSYLVSHTDGELATLSFKSKFILPVFQTQA